MIDEDKSAIKNLNSYVNAIDTFGTIDPKCCNNLYEPVKTVLNLIEKQEKMIDLMIEHVAEIECCLLESLDFDCDCANRCDTASEKECWRIYFEKKVSE